MKIITIGRGENSHIFIDNPLVSRQHAILKIQGNGRMTIVDKSSNGTSINGSPIKKERECPVSRRDVVTFAGVTQLDWKEVPDPLKIYKIIGLVLAGLAVALGIFFGIKSLIPEKEPVIPDTPVTYSTPPAQTTTPQEKVMPPETKPAEPTMDEPKLKDVLRGMGNEKSGGSSKATPKQPEKPKSAPPEESKAKPKPKEEPKTEGTPIFF